MRVSLQWLKELVDCDQSVADISQQLSLAGFEVDNIEDLATLTKNTVVGFVLQQNPHPTADKLNVCWVDIGEEVPVQIVCGAPNIREGIHVPVAKIGAILPGVSFTVTGSQLRGIVSNGMICSLKELGKKIVKDEGIVILEDLIDQVPIPGTLISLALGMNDVILDLAITANRPDSLSIIGIAREVAALTGAELRLPITTPLSQLQDLEVSEKMNRIIAHSSYYTLTEISGLKISASPLWIQYRLENAGIQPVNNIVDILNYVMIEQGQPMCAFDQDALRKISESDLNLASLGLRRSYIKENFTYSDKDETVQLSSECLVITYEDYPIGLAGVTGSTLTSVNRTTSSIWLEAAIYAPQDVRINSRYVGLRTESSSRFEKGVARELTLKAVARAVALLEQFASGVKGKTWICQETLSQTKPITLRSNTLQKLLGPIQIKNNNSIIRLTNKCIEKILSALDCKLEITNQGWNVQVPPTRQLDLLREIDLIEEVARLIGFDNFTSHLPDPITPGGLSNRQKIEREIRTFLTNAGLQEMVSFSLVASTHSDANTNPEDRIPLANPLLSETSHLRESLWPEHIKAARRNLQASQVGYWAFEIGHVFRLRPNEKTPEQLAILSGIISGKQRASSWDTSGKVCNLNFYEAISIVESMFIGLKIMTTNLPITKHPLLHPGRGAEIAIDKYPVGWFGQIHPQLAEQNDLPEISYLFELRLEELLSVATQETKLRPLFKTFATAPASDRDLSMIVPSGLPSGDLLQAILKADIPLLENAQLIDRFDGEQMGEGKCSLTFRLRYRGMKETLTDKEVNLVHEELKNNLKKQFPIVLRV
uniref:Phenylalanine--tRNA ligase beta subunit n=1 Tax=Paulinella longichromatophora TaxID=1708747 RepID=A0A2H4ZNS7_9EUKA|nr:Phenylalanyl-tRNA synthetase beta subunit [Paulinella longichromatophora]